MCGCCASLLMGILRVESTGGLRALGGGQLAGVDGCSGLESGARTGWSDGESLRWRREAERAAAGGKQGTVGLCQPGGVRIAAFLHTASLAPLPISKSAPSLLGVLMAVGARASYTVRANSGLAATP